MTKPHFSNSNPYALAASLEAAAHDIRLLASGSLPELDVAPHLETWRLTTRASTALVGIVTGHPLIGEHHRAVTSEVLAIDRSRRWARTLSRFYVLGAEKIDG